MKSETVKIRNYRSLEKQKGPFGAEGDGIWKNTRVQTGLIFAWHTKNDFKMLESHHF